MKITIRKRPTDHVMSEYGDITYQDWCNKEVPRLNRTIFCVMQKNKIREYFNTLIEANVWIIHAPKTLNKYSIALKYLDHKVVKSECKQKGGVIQIIARIKEKK